MGSSYHPCLNAFTIIVAKADQPQGDIGCDDFWYGSSVAVGHPFSTRDSTLDMAVGQNESCSYHIKSMGRTVYLPTNLT